MRERRRRRGSIDFDLPEAQFLVDDAGRVEAVVAAERNLAHRIIEEFMLVANETVASHLAAAGVPGLFRVHEAPDPVRVEDFEAFAATLGHSLAAPPNAVAPMHFQRLIERLADTPEARPVVFLMLRTMQQARYDPANLGHYGLAATSYTHFTSPIRRYPDLVVHRVLRAARQGTLDADRRQALEEDLPEIARQTSERERRAEEAERELVHWKKVRFMADKVGDEFSGYVTGAASFGLFVELIEHFVEGLVHVSSMADDYYRFVAEQHLLYGEYNRGRRTGSATSFGCSSCGWIGSGANSTWRWWRFSTRCDARATAAPRAGGRGLERSVRGAVGSAGGAVRASPTPALRRGRPNQPSRIRAVLRRGFPGSRRTRQRAQALSGRSCDDHPVRHIVVGTAGHIDHGKSTLVEALTGIDPDRLREEKARGITIDLGFAPYVDGETALAFVDVPGHERFIRNMLAGASGIDCVLLVIAADESVMPQTREHFDICRLLGVGAGAVALTKADLVDDETLELVRLETSELVAGSFLDAAPVIPVSARTGTGIDALRAVLARMAATAPGRSDDGVARLPIDRAFSMRGFGTVVTGTLVSGRIAANTEIVLMPGGRRIKVRGVQVHGEARPVSHAGQRVALNLAGVEVGDLVRGDTLADVAGLEATRRIDVVVALLPDARGLKHGARVRFHQGTTEIMARVALGATAGPRGTGDERAPTVSGAEGGHRANRFPALLAPGGRAYARLHLERPAAITRGDRFVLRAYSPPLTIAGGKVLDPRPPRGRLQSAAGRARCERLASEDAGEAVRVMIEEAGGEGVSRAEITIAGRLAAGRRGGDRAGVHGGRRRGVDRRPARGHGPAARSPADAGRGGHRVPSRAAAGAGPAAGGGARAFAPAGERRGVRSRGLGAGRRRHPGGHPPSGLGFPHGLAVSGRSAGPRRP